MARSDGVDGVPFSSVIEYKLDLEFLKKKISDQIPILNGRGKKFLSLAGSALISDWFT